MSGRHTGRGLIAAVLCSIGLICLPQGGWRPLHSACSVGHTQVVDSLLQAGAAVTARNALGATPLHYAASKGHADIVRLLLKHGADATAKDHAGSTVRT